MTAPLLSADLNQPFELIATVLHGLRFGYLRGSALIDRVPDPAVAADRAGGGASSSKAKGKKSKKGKKGKSKAGVAWEDAMPASMRVESSLQFDDRLIFFFVLRVVRALVPLLNTAITP